jgi:gliding motility-associated-like protein
MLFFNPLTQPARSFIGIVFLFFIAQPCKVVAQGRTNSEFLRAMDSLAPIISSKTATGNSTRQGNQLISAYKPSHQQRNILSSARTAGGANCQDTSSRIAIVKDSIHFYVTNPATTRNGDLLVSGEYYNYWDTVSSSKGFLIRTDKYGHVRWAKLYDSLNHVNYHYLNYYNLIELNDGSILLAGSSTDRSSENDDMVLTKVDANGNIIWSREYYARTWQRGNGSADWFYIMQMKQDAATGDIYLSSGSWAGGVHLIKVETPTGNILWSNQISLYTNGYGSEQAGGFVIRANDIILTGSKSPYWGSYVFFYRINKANGDTLSTKIFSLSDTLARAFLTMSPLQELSGGRFALSGSLVGQWRYLYDGSVPLYQAGVAIFDSSLNYEKGYCFRNNIESNMSNTRITVHPDGSGLFSMMKYIGSYTGEMYYTQFNDGIITKQRKRFFSGEGYPYEPNSIFNGPGGDMIVQMMGDAASTSPRSSIVISKLHLTDTFSDCMGTSTAVSFVDPMDYVYYPYNFTDSVRKSIMLERKVRTITAASLSLKPPVYVCEQVSFCDTLKLTASLDTTCPGMPIIIKTFKNKGCGSMVQFTYDTSAVSTFVQLTDTTYKLVFKKGWEGFLRGSLSGCITHTDSVKLTILEAPATLSLGSDRDICTGNNFLLNARKGFGSYLWQNGSTDSVFRVTAPGKYYIKVTNACGGELSDTVVISAHVPAAFSAGIDRTLCKNDSVTIAASPGFTNYQWTTLGSAIQNSHNATIKVSPQTSTNFYVTAEESPNCIVQDTVKVTVLAVPEIKLGADTSFCSGQKVMFDAGFGFQHYNWSNGDTTRQITVGAAGIYKVVAVTAEKCSAADTITVKEVYANPVVTLGTDSTLCFGAQRRLDAGNFSSYLWNTGAVTRVLDVKDTGYYVVVVADIHSCVDTGSVHISHLVLPPANFLPADTSICNYQELTITPLRSFERYHWSTGVNNRFISTNKAGQYWLQVTDKNNCMGSDSIYLSEKQCMQGLYVPNAFTPNGDRVNNVFRPLLFGNIEYYEFSVFNRFGQKIFTSKDQLSGWDGTYNLLPQNPGAFVWVCGYKLVGEKTEVKKGTFLLIR